MKKILLTVAVTAMMIPAVFANNFEETADAIEYRQAAFGLIAYNFGDMGAMLKGKKPFDAAVFSARADNVAALSKIPHEGFIAGSDKGDTEALAKIWQDKADFDSKMTAFQDNAAALAVAAKTTDENNIKQAFTNTGKSCKGCHDVYKKD
ncbi:MULTISPECIES: c-type cytochrome [Shewanella]|jgi:cytochrome c556|uniref:Cytochrome c n=1 Tax=Shewanella psychromarinicola TaxID=2487742 RepID=A0A3N4E3Y7_9GAMM|nr:cytochrome c [Shewanella psychromarinicola]AZG35287.1 cytochrome c [Shewanella psychromarinicola]MCL1081611.1 cytochrome c [Shewanella psychromarinicola]RPA32909.1 cytochrome c [Shewanella psychromarinicola]